WEEEHNLTMIMSTMGRPGEAIEHAKRAVSLLPTTKETAGLRALNLLWQANLCRQTMGDSEAVRNLYRSVVSLTDGQPLPNIRANACVNLAAMFLKSGDIEHALEYARLGSAAAVQAEKDRDIVAFEFRPKGGGLREAALLLQAQSRNIEAQALSARR